MTKNIVCSTLLFIFLYLQGNSQIQAQPALQFSTPSEKCGFDMVHNWQIQNNPVYQQKTIEFNQQVKNFIPPVKVSQTSYRIPVVVHVMETGNSLTSITDQQIRDAIRTLNERYRKVPGGAGDGNGVDVELEFALAVRDPNGNCTNGIVRFDMTWNSTYMSSGVFYDAAGISDSDLKSYSVWDQTQYYNIWLVSEIDNNNGGSGTQGYAYFASAHGSSIDGAVILTTNFNDASSTTGAHELGHAFNLYHTFEGDNNGLSCPTNTSCSADGDRVCDTPPHIRSSSNCVIGTNACDGGSSTELFIHNYMDYSSDACQDEFTDGQKTRVLAALTVTRASFLEANGNLSLVPPSAAQVLFESSSSGGCTGSAIQFYDLSSCIPNTYLDTTGWAGVTFNWTFDNNAGTVLTSTLQNPLITFNNTGIYDVTLAITNSFGTTTSTFQGFVVITGSVASATCNPSSSYAGTLTYGIFQVQLNTLAHSSSSTLNDNNSGLTVNGYGDFSCTESTILQPNTTYPLSIQGTTNSGLIEDFKVYIDYNNDGDFVDVGEEVAFWNNLAGNSGLVSQNITTPVSPVMNTLLRMRVVSGRDSETLTPCFTTTRGQAHDFGVYFSNSIASVSIAALPSTTISYGTNVTVTATPVNGGTSPTYQWYLNGAIIPGETSSTYSNSTFIDGDQVYCVMTSNLSGVISSPATSNTITFTVTGPPLSDFSASPLMICAGSTVTFEDLSALAPTSWNWTFTGGTPSSSTSQNPAIVYNTPGTYSVTLTASNGLGTGTTETKTNFITVFSTPGAQCTTFSRSNTPTTGNEIGILNVKLNTIDKTTTNTDAVYQSFVCSDLTELNVSTAYNLSVRVSSVNAQWIRVYIDYNNNNSFLDAGELIYTINNVMGTNSTSFTTPASPILNTLLRMRVVSDFGSTTGAGPCKNPMNYGQVEDYGVVLRNSCTTPATPVVTVTDNCGSSVLSTTGSNLLWSTGETTSSITVSSAGTYTVTQTVSGCTSAPGSGVANPITIPSAPTVSVTNNCGSSILSATGSNLLWSTAETTSSITVSSAGTYTVTQTVGGCTSAPGSGVASPIAIPAAPTVTVTDNCGSSILSATGSNLLWSTAETTASITVSSAGSYTVTQTVGGCTSTPASASANPISIPPTPTVSVTNNCGNSVLTASGSNFLWSTAETTSSITVTSGGTYTVTQTVSGCTSAPGSGTANPIVIPSAPTVTVTDNCGSSVLSATGSNLLWSTAETTASITVTSGGTYTVTQTVGGCTSAPGTGTANPIVIPSAPTVTVTDNCGSSVLSATGSNLLWSTSEITSSITVSSASTYTVTQTVGGCTSAPGSGTANPIAIPSAPIVTVMDNCGNSVLSATGSNLLWSTAETTASITVTSSGSYTVTQTVGGCTSVPASATANPIAIPSAPTVTVTDNCGNSVLTATGSNFLWSTAETTSSITVSSAGTYTVTQTVGGCTSAPGSGTANPLTIPATPSVTVTDNCGSSVLSATGSNLLWSTTETTASITVSSAGTYTVTQTVGTCTSAPGSGTANPIAIPTAPVVTVTDNCGNSVLTTSGSNLLWSTSETTSSITVTGAGTYTVTQTIGGCTSAPGSGTANPIAIPSAPIVTVTDNCGNSVLTATGSNLLWSTAETTSSITVTSAGIYTVTQTVGTCTSPSGSGIASPMPSPVISLGGTTDPTSCVTSDGTITVNGSGTGDLSWSGAMSGNVTSITFPFTISGLSDGSFAIVFNDGCASNTLSVTLSDPSSPASPVVSVTDNCGNSVLTASGSNLLWSTSETTATITVTSPGTYSVTQTLGGCTSTPASITAAPVPIPDAPIVTVNDNCGNSVLTASGSNLLWSTAETTATITVTGAGTYTVTQTVGGCTSAPGSGIANPISIPSAPIVTVTDNCGNSVLTATGSNLLWSTAETTASITVTSAGTYSVTQTISGCISPSGSGTASPLVIPVISLGGTSDPTTCVATDGTITINGSGTGDLSWTGSVNGNVTSVALPFTITGLINGTYDIVFNDGCNSNTLSATLINTFTPASPTVSVVDNCGNSVLTATGSNLLWSTSETSSSITVTSAGTYSVTQTVSGCTSAPATITANPLTIPSAPIVTVTDNCGNSVLTATGSNLLWSTSETSSSITVTGAGIYTVTQTINGCTSAPGSGIANPISIPAAPTVSVVDNCGNSVLTATGSNLLWSTSETSSSVTVTGAGVYTVTQTVNGCISAAASVTASPLAIPTVTFDPLSDVCINTPIFNLTGGSPSGGTYSGTGVNSNQFDPSVSGFGTFVITYTFTDVNSCSASAQQSIVVGCAGIEEEEIMGITIYPNPSNGLFTVTSQNVIGSIKIYDGTGKLVQVLDNETESEIMKVDLTLFAEGVYSMVLYTKTEVFNQRIILVK